ncbi:multidrug efflux system outer membrane protein [Silvimonas terrae]|uniref:Multidrug efflux system outer membrane protein n=1 Tax=Silvimonas terrae TaxID=300266 RepID=A0A840R885_9NEIS|nr:efflux transporter outer membrane subunit [Silvimonas terrae]MBB5189515.1 multidrug efflux system outer membrane protein [Silvimonas terrae]
MNKPTTLFVTPRRALIAALLALTLPGCAFMQPDKTAPATELPAAERMQSDAGWIDNHWWDQFGDPLLAQLIQTARTNNQNLAQAVARVDQARAVVGINSSAQFPQLDLQGAGAKQKVSGKGPQATLGTYTDYQLAAAASWELDIWGRLANLTEGARRDLMAAEYNRDAVSLALDAEVAQTYFNLIALDGQLQIARDTIQSRVESYDLQTKRFKGGLISELDVRQSEAELNTAQAAEPNLVGEIAQTESALAVLLGETPQQIIETLPERGKRIDEIGHPPVIPSGLPSDLLLRRPDIQQAEATLIGARARVEAARAAYFPTISLTGLAGVESLAFGDLFTGAAKTWSFAGNLGMPLFNGGLTAAQVDQARGIEREALAVYRGTVQSAFGDVRAALVVNDQAAKATEALRNKVQALTRQLRLANLRYDNGYSSYLDVLDTERNLFDARLSLVQAQLAELNDRVSLYKAVGGGWRLAADQSASAAQKTTN